MPIFRKRWWCSARNGIKRNDPDYYAGFVMNDILGGGSGLTSRLATEIREKRGLAYSVYSQLEPLTHSASMAAADSPRATNKVGATALETLARHA